MPTCCLAQVHGASSVHGGSSGWTPQHSAECIATVSPRVSSCSCFYLVLYTCRSAAPPKAVYLLGADDYSEEDVPDDAFVVYQV